MRIFLIDADNFNAPTWVDEAFRKLESAEGTFAVRRAYGSSDSIKALSETLRKWAIRPFCNQSLSKNTTDLSLAIDAMELAMQIPKPSLVALASGDADFVPLVVRLRERGIRVICMSDKTKMASEAAPAYDQVIYVGDNQSSRTEQPASTVAVKSATPAKSKPRTSAKNSAAKASTKEETTTPSKAPAAKKAPKSTNGSAIDGVSVSQILSSAPALKSGDWQPLGEIAKALHDAKLLGKNAASTKLFKKFPQSFEVLPAGKPNRVRLLGSTSETSRPNRES